MTLQEVLTSIDEAKKARDFMKDLSPGNSMIIQEKCGGKFEAVTINGSDKICLIPQIEGSFFYLEDKIKSIYHVILPYIVAIPPNHKSLSIGCD